MGEVAIPEYDLLIVGGGINGCGIARDAAGRGLRVLLCEQHDLAQHTSSASSKLIHGGLRYLEQFEFRLVHEALTEREILLKTAPHLIHPMRFVLPHVPTLRPAWIIRAGLFLYDTLARRDILPASQRVNLATPPYASGLQSHMRKGFIYSDCWVDDARLAIANARAARELGAKVLTQTECVSASRKEGLWQACLRRADLTQHEIKAKALINVSGPWATQFLNHCLRIPFNYRIKLVQGSHIIVPRLYQGEHAFILQNDDRRVVFAYPYQDRFTLIGTTDVNYQGDPAKCTVSEEEIAYLCRAANRYFSQTIKHTDVRWSYCGIRPLFDDGGDDPSKVTRDYTLRVDGGPDQAPVLTVLGGKITTYRKLAEHALTQLAGWFPRIAPSWTATSALPGGALQHLSFATWFEKQRTHYNALPQPVLLALAQRHGSNLAALLGSAKTEADLGEHFGHTLYAREVDYQIKHEWAHTPEDVVWRRTKTGLHLNTQQKQQLADYLHAQGVTPVR
jgi:glycerol-3-phosphate dehydrogenase